MGDRDEGLGLSREGYGYVMHLTLVLKEENDPYRPFVFATRRDDQSDAERRLSNRIRWELLVSTPDTVRVYQG